MAAGPETCITPAAMPSTGSSGLPEAFLLLSKPGIVLAETTAGLAGMLLASKGLHAAPSAVWWCLLCLIMAASGAAMTNCALEAETDRKMTRLTDRNQALATVGKSRLLTVAMLFMGGAFLLAGMFLNLLTLLLLTAACSSYLLIYTVWLKRRSPWSVLAGALPGALPPMIGAAALTDRVTELSLLLGSVIFIWQLPHFWFLALQHTDQYRQAGIPVLPLTHGIRVTKGLTLSCAATLLPATCTFGLIGSFSPGFMLAALLSGFLFPLLCYRYLYRTSEYRKGFILSLGYLTVIFVAIISDVIMAMKL